MLIEYIDIFYKFFLALILGALIGVEREKSQQQHKGTDFAGIRTFMLIGFLGATAAYLSTIYFEWLLAVILVCFIFLVLAAYIVSSYINKQAGMTTELSAVIVFAIGILSVKSSPEIPILATIIITIILSFKSHLHQFVYNLKSEEFFDTLKFILIAFVILPLLKNIESFGPFDAINLYEIWLMVVFVSGLSFIGYVLIKLLGSNKGIIFTGLLGGILSSTAVVTSLASKSKEENSSVSSLVIASAIACATMFLRVLIEVSILNLNMIEKLAFPMVMLSLAGYLSVSILWKHRDSQTETEFNFKSPLMLGPALKFGLFFGFISVLSNVLSSDQILGAKGILIVGLISGLADVDAIVIFVARNIGFDITTGIMAIVLAATVNTIVKLIIGRVFGSREYGKALSKVLLPIIAVGLFMILIL